MFGDELLVAGDDGFAGFQGAANPGAGEFQAADQFYDDVDVGAEDLIKVLGPDHARWNPVRFFAGDGAVKDVRELEAAGFEVAEDARDGAADSAESQDGNFH